ncbi:MULTISPECIES: type II toxin-antitoxin system CcdA family antitoxin [unclassified Thioalkalivibrio]|uniref:type II toxin-antitoxin system CcdA family antitoxin n=1 Tax=unclassified Thioalkalivibrio TaxID=2621013 RepID=UPI00035C8184|nr:MULTISPECIES: type II toxin-antitoxin system CcdA family antitoxin [unclassified Thioalkalivibrio]
MNLMPYNTDAPRKATNLTVNSDLLAQARELGINLSALFEQQLVQAVREARRDAWIAENRQALAGYNQRVAERGSFGDRARRF